MNITTMLLVFACFGVLCFSHSIDHKKHDKRISALEKEVFPEVVDDKKSN